MSYAEWYRWAAAQPPCQCSHSRSQHSETEPAECEWETPYGDYCYCRGYVPTLGSSCLNTL